MLFGKLLQIDLSNKRISEINVEKDIIKNFIGAKGLGAYLLYTMLKSQTDPLSSDNLLMFLNGPLTGTSFPTSGRTTVVTKSPLTGLFLDSHAGGFFGPELKKTGYDGIVLKGASEKPVYLWINDGKVEIRDATGIWGLPVSETVKKIREDTDEKAHVASIGPAGENLVKFASITIDKDSDPWRAGIAARGGPGAVMGSKKLKAIAVKGSGKVKVYDEEKFKELSSKLTKKVTDNTFVHTRRVLGTSYWIDPMNRMGILPTRNFQSGYIENGYGLIGSNMKYYSKRDVSCYNCTIMCGKVLNVNGNDVKVEYEDIALLGSNNGMTDVLDVAKALVLCNELGLDALSTGGTVAFAMECAEKGILKDAPEFGDAEGQRKLINDIAYKNGIGKLLSEGTKRASEKLGQNSTDFAINVKGLELPGYSPRSSWGMALAYATSDRGGCHQRAWTVRAEVDGVLKRFSTEGIAQFVKDVQDERAAAFSLVVCDFVPLSIDDFMSGLKYGIGVDLDEKEYIKVGERIWNLVRLFNIREAGISRKDDTLPRRMFKEPLPMPPKGKEKISLPKESFDEMLSEYYYIRGWNENGIPTKEKLVELNLNEI
ncbi:MAG: aldehyde ferredoxin oxidoreductase family protein [Caldiserica bacterium]|nr:aldehyde ferredoxin oxidoreductase family protein [Caldisericota bacterium]